MDAIEHDPRDPNDTEPFRIERGMTGDPKWVVRMAIDGGWVVVFRGQSKEDCVSAIAPFFIPERRLLARIAELEAECEALRADVVWLLAHKMIGYGDRISYAKEPRSWSLRKELDHDGTPDGILRAVREARTR